MSKQAKQWYRLSFKGQEDAYAQLTEEEAARMAEKYQVEACEQPAWVPEKIGRLIADLAPIGNTEQEAD